LHWTPVSDQHRTATSVSSVSECDNQNFLLPDDDINTNTENIVRHDDSGPSHKTDQSVGVTEDVQLDDEDATESPGQEVASIQPRYGFESDINTDVPSPSKKKANQKGKKEKK
jgi:hypothetical protein